jgi:hypothetical protein
MDKEVNLPFVASSLLLSVVWSVYNRPIIPPNVPTYDIDKQIKLSS